jgi:protein associated with RNAse G/E
MRRVHMDSRKWPDQKHWQYEMIHLGDDEHGVWLYAAARTIAQRGDEPPRELRTGFVSLVPRDQWWIIEFYWTHPQRELYVNIGTPPTWHADRIHQIDLDLDVVRNHDGSIEILDEDEFAEHRRTLGYPDHLIDGARSAADQVAQQLHTNAEPFGNAAPRWIERAQTAG